MGSDLFLILPSVPAQGRADLSHLGLCYLMPPAEGFHGHRHEGDALLAAELFSAPHLPLVGNSQGVAMGGSCTSPGGSLQGMNHCDVQSRISASCPVPEEDVGWATIIAWEEARPSLTGARPASAAVLKSASRRALP